ncbi:MAG: response regulator [Anaerolineae bacterium]|nr:response regulator [Anaerolineae bacterium]
MFRLTILVVNNNADIRTILAETLYCQGCIVVTVKNISEALVMLANAYFDIILLDVALSDESDLGKIAQMRVLQPQIKIIMLTARDENAVRDVACRVGADACLRKPVPMFQLMDMVEQAMTNCNG